MCSAAIYDACTSYTTFHVQHICQYLEWIKQLLQCFNDGTSSFCENSQSFGSMIFILDKNGSLKNKSKTNESDVVMF